MAGRYTEREISVGSFEYEKLQEKAEELDTDIATIISYLVEDYLDELEEL
ncbi:MAG: hypothetical protein IKN47_01595 [Lachnospiraceae bacterium]|nr:hypothetical protein [Lachnospiraceae bacterium]